MIDHVAVYSLTEHFRHFFSRLNPARSFEAMASSEYNTIKGLIEDPNGPAAELSPRCFLQGSYRQQTAIYSINDLDIVVLCNLWYPGSGGGGGKSYGRDEIFELVAAPLRADGRYRSKLRFGPTSMCIKVDLGIKVEILPVVFKSGITDPSIEPFILWRPETNNWEDGYARFHQSYLSQKNRNERTQGNFIPAVKVFKHLRSKLSPASVSFHIECLLHALDDSLFWGGPADYLEALFTLLSSNRAEDWYALPCMTPCGDRDVFTPSEWSLENWSQFHKVMDLGAKAASLANQQRDKSEAIKIWQILLGPDFFPATVS
jgi:hypothetical protein